jgi:hypothetical protein
VVGAHAFARGAPLGFGGHDPDGTVFQPGRPSARAHQRISRDGSDQQSSRCATLVQRLSKPSADYELALSGRFVACSKYRMTGSVLTRLNS